MKMEANILIWGKKDKMEYWEIFYLLIFFALTKFARAKTFVTYSFHTVV